MAEEAEVARELERLRAELMGFVVAELGDRMASGEQAELSAALSEAIERRVDAAISAKVGGATWPDPDAFAEQVLLAAARGGKGSGQSRSRSSAQRRGGGSSDWKQFGLGFATALALAAVAVVVYLMLVRSEPTTQTNVQSPPPLVNGLENVSDGQLNVMIEGNDALPAPAPPANGAAPFPGAPGQ